MKKKCELCNSSSAKMYCDSDQASLCWACDARVHSANFLVAKHERTLLCHVCQSPTPWTAAGPRLRPTVSPCPACILRTEDRVDDDAPRSEHEDGTDDEDDEDDQDEDDGDDEEEECNEDEGSDDGGNQVVPLCSTSSSGVDSKKRSSRIGFFFKS